MPQDKILADQKSTWSYVIINPYQRDTETFLVDILRNLTPCFNLAEFSQNKKKIYGCSSQTLTLEQCKTEQDVSDKVKESLLFCVWHILRNEEIQKKDKIYIVFSRIQCYWDVKLVADVYEELSNA